MRTELISALAANQTLFGVLLDKDVMERLADYYELVVSQNELLHLVGPCSPEEFATRHILESLTLVDKLAPSARFADVGAGAGLPSIPCLLARTDLTATLIESKEKKSKFLDEAVAALGLSARAKVVNRQFDEVNGLAVDLVTCRALDKFAAKLRRLVQWSERAQLGLFGGPGLAGELARLKLPFERRLMPLSEQRFLFYVSSRGNAKHR